MDDLSTTKADIELFSAVFGRTVVLERVYLGPQTVQRRSPVTRERLRTVWAHEIVYRAPNAL